MAFKVLHTSDWHLGKRLYKAERLDEQRLFLDWILQTIKDEDIELLLIAGDVFDTPFPPTEALTLYFDFLRKLCDQSDCQVAIIAGNHDSGRFLEAPLPFLKDRRISILGQIPQENPAQALKNYISKSGEELELYFLPFFRNHEIEDLRSFLGCPAETGLEETLDLFFEKTLPKKTKPRLLLGHHQFGSFEAEGSELTLSISGISSLPLDVFKKHFDYGAFGHIHKQAVLSSAPYMVYSGSPIPWRFSEQNEKQVFIITAKEQRLEVQKHPIPTFRKLFRLKLEQENWEGELQKKLAKEYTSLLRPFAEVHMRLERPSHAIAEKVKKNLEEKGIELLAYHVELSEILPQAQEHSWRDLSLEHLFKSYHKEKYQNDNCSDELLQSFRELLGLIAQEKDA